MSPLLSEVQKWWLVISHSLSSQLNLALAIPSKSQPFLPSFPIFCKTVNILEGSDPFSRCSFLIWSTSVILMKTAASKKGLDFFPSLMFRPVSLTSVSSLFPYSGSKTGFVLRSAVTISSRCSRDQQAVAHTISGFDLLQVASLHSLQGGRKPNSHPPTPFCLYPKKRGGPKLGSNFPSCQNMASLNQNTMGEQSLSLILPSVQCHNKIPCGLFHLCSQWLKDKHLIKSEVISGIQLRMKHAAAPAWLHPPHSDQMKLLF